MIGRELTNGEFNSIFFMAILCPQLSRCIREGPRNVIVFRPVVLCLLNGAITTLTG